MWSNQIQFKYEILEFVNPKGDKVYFDIEIEEKLNNNTSILDKILSSHRSPEDKTGLDYDKTIEKVCDRKKNQVKIKL